MTFMLVLAHLGTFKRLSISICSTEDREVHCVLCIAHLLFPPCRTQQNKTDVNKPDEACLRGKGKKRAALP